jgi:hypothetical protein
MDKATATKTTATPGNDSKHRVMRQQNTGGKSMLKTVARVTGAVTIAALLGVGCSNGMTGHQMMSAPAAAAPRDSGTAPAAMSAAELRTGLNTLLREHVYLAAAATGAALGGRSVEFQAAAGALDANSVDISKAIGAVYGADAEQAFLPLWRKHIGFVVDYTQGVAARDKAKQDKAVAELVQYTQDFGAFLSAANPNLPKNAVADLVKMHVLTLKDVIDAQASGNEERVYTALRQASGHMAMIADPLAEAIVKQFPSRYAI